MDRQRIDKWLWHARVARTRTAAAGLVQSGHVRVNGRRVETASHAVRPGDVLTVALHHTVRVIKVTAFAERRGSAEVASGLYEGLGGVPDRPSAHAEIAARDRGDGRPTKRDRRAIDRFTRGSE
ncbi:MAG TPA: RNA-binding S4 domain-containing protein [Xanthobacteraceae bacterium]